MKKALIYGQVIRVARLCNPLRVEFTVRSMNTCIDNHTFTLGEDVNCEVPAFSHRRADLTEAALNLAAGDSVVLEMAEISPKIWQLNKLESRAYRGRPVSDFLNDVVAEIGFWDSKK